MRYDTFENRNSPNFDLHTLRVISNRPRRRTQIERNRKQEKKEKEGARKRERERGANAWRIWTVANRRHEVRRASSRGVPSCHDAWRRDVAAQTRLSVPRIVVRASARRSTSRVPPSFFCSSIFFWYRSVACSSTHHATPRHVFGEQASLDNDESIIRRRDHRPPEVVNASLCFPRRCAVIITIFTNDRRQSSKRSRSIGRITFLRFSSVLFLEVS